jgi:hypothetical protein
MMKRPTSPSASMPVRAGGLPMRRRIGAAAVAFLLCFPAALVASGASIFSAGSLEETADWKRGGTDPSIAVWSAEAGGGALGLVDERSDAFGSWLSPMVAIGAGEAVTEPTALEIAIGVRHSISGGQMRLLLRSFSAQGRQIDARNVHLYSGTTGAWSAGRFEQQQHVAVVPAGTAKIRLEVVSGPAMAKGELFINALSVSPLIGPGGVPPLVRAPAQLHGLVHPSELEVLYNASEVPRGGAVLMADEFGRAPFGSIPPGWRDLTFARPSRNWAVDAFGYLRPILKNWRGLLAYEGTLTTAQAPQDLRDYLVASSFKTSGDSDVNFGIAGRIQEAGDRYVVQLAGSDHLQIFKVSNGERKLLAELALLRRYQPLGAWRLEASFFKDLISGILYDEAGRTMARVDARDGEYATGGFGLDCTDFAAAKDISCHGQGQVEAVRSVAEALQSNAVLQPVYDGYSLVQPLAVGLAEASAFADLERSYDVVVAGGGTGGFSAALQAARQGMRVLLVEETDWLGGQMGAAGTTSMDDAGCQVRERGIYREFHESMVIYYYGLDKTPFNAYYYRNSAQHQTEGGYEPAVVQGVLYGMLQRERERGGVIDLALRSRVVEVVKEGPRVTGAVIERWNPDGKPRRSFACRILVDATEYGDVIPLTGAAYRVGNTTSGSYNPKGAVQSHSFNIIFREYPEGIPANLRMTVPPPGYEAERNRFRRAHIHGDWHFHQGDRNFRILMAWRGAADTHSPMIGRKTEQRHTAASTNWGNNYSVAAATIEDPDRRLEDERTGVYRMLSALYYLQNELGLPWSAAAEQGFDTPYNELKMRERGIVEEVMPFARLMCQIPYVRESRRVVGIRTLVADELTRWEEAKLMPTSIAMGDYFMDLHGTYEQIEPDLDRIEHPRGNGPFQVPFEVFIPEELDGFLPAEKNFSQSRLVNGATRLQPITMLTGQAVGSIAALAIARNQQPRQLAPQAVQLSLLDSGSTLIQRWHSDVEWGTELWRAVQFLSLYGLLDRPGRLAGDRRMSFETPDAWGADEVVGEQEIAAVIQHLSKLFPPVGHRLEATRGALGGSPRRADFAVWLLQAVREELLPATAASLTTPLGRQFFHEVPQSNS